MANSWSHRQWWNVLESTQWTRQLWFDSFQGSKVSWKEIDQNWLLTWNDLAYLWTNWVSDTTQWAAVTNRFSETRVAPHLWIQRPDDNRPRLAIQGQGPVGRGLDILVGSELTMPHLLKPNKMKEKETLTPMRSQLFKFWPNLTLKAKKTVFLSLYYYPEKIFSLV